MERVPGPAGRADGLQAADRQAPRSPRRGAARLGGGARDGAGKSRGDRRARYGRRAAARALESLPVRPDVVLLDGKHDYIGRPWTVRTLIKADLHSVSVAAASVIAKVSRDRLMDDIGEDYPDFAFAASPAADRERQARRPPSATAGSKCRTAK